jgi:leader peptidase (prepilin peptidase)/N-methyltransferase
VEESAALLSSPAALVLAAVLGAVWGSFFNVCIARIPLGQSVVRPGSRCMACGTPVRAIDNVPIFSYLWLRGRCRACGARFSVRYALVELLAAGLAVAIWWRFVTDDPGGVVAIRLARFVLYFAFTGALLVLSFIDLDTKLLPDVITLPSIPIFFLGAFGAHDVPWLERAIGAAAGYLFIRLIADAYYYLRKREGMGLGDGKLLAVVGALLGWKALPIVIFTGAFAGTLISVPLLVLARRRAAQSAPAAGRRHSAGDNDKDDGHGADDGADESLRNTEVPFGPFLALGALVYLFAGQAVQRWLLGQT